jgi:tripartite-type tricarboxylate transporter receptor subunit TctC
MIMRRRSVLLLASLAFGCLSAEAVAQAWPTRPIRAIVPFSAGSTTDIIPRIVFDQLAAELGQAIIVENRGGAGGTIGAGAVAKSDPDGYTILANSSAHAVSPAIIPNMPYDTARDFSAVIPFGISPNVLVVSASRGVKTAQEFVAALKAKPGSVNFSSAGVGTGTHMSAERFRLSAGVDAVHVPFRGGPEALTEVMGGRVDFYFGPVGTVLSSVREGKVLALAVNGAKRSSALPDVPTLQEAGFKDADYPIWYGVFVPAKTPRDIVDKLHRETLKALQAPKVHEKLAAIGVDPMAMSPAEFDAHVKKEIDLNTALVKAAGIKPN